MRTIKSVEAMCDRIMRSTKQFIPLIVEIDLTYRCPNNCIHCFQKNMKMDPDLSKEVLLETIDILCDMGTLEFKISGGDPLIREDIFDILEHLSRKNVRVVLYTAGYFLDEDTCKRIAQLGITRVETTLLGPNRLVHDKLANCPGSFDYICNGIKTLKRIGVDQYVKYIVMQQNFQVRSEIRQLEEELGIQIAPSPYLWCKHGDPERTIEVCRLTDSQLYDYFLEVPQPPIKRTFLSCGAGKYMMGIAADGSVTPCASFSREYSVGNIYEKAVDDIWREAPFLLELRRNIRYMIPECRTCSKSDFCRMCPAIASWGGQNIKSPYAPMCHYADIAEKAYVR